MKPEPLDHSEVPNANTASLGRALGRSQKIKVAIKRAAGRLTSANAMLKGSKGADSTARRVEQAITLYEDVEDEVAQAAHDLTQVNADLAVEVAVRVGIESELADTKADLADVRVDLAIARDDLSESQASVDEALQRALHDPLTGLPNRVLFDQGLDQGLIQARRHGWRLAVLFIDVDDFKSINDSYGHHVGDEVLLMIADRLRSFVRAEDMISRRGGDEFVCLLLEVAEQAEVNRLARSIISRIAEEFESGGTTLSVGSSIGIAMYPGDGESADVLLRNADEAMYRAKQTSERVVLCGSITSER